MRTIARQLPRNAAPGTNGEPRRERDHRAERAAGADAEHVRRRERVADQGLEEEPRDRERGADDRGRERAREPVAEHLARVERVLIER